MKVSTRGDYAARALLSLALHGSERPTSVKEIAERTTLPQPYLEQILLAVKGAGLVRSKRGVGGGYVLARARQRDHARRHRRARSRARNSRSASTPTTAKGTASCRRCGSACPTRRAATSNRSARRLVERTRVGHAGALRSAAEGTGGVRAALRAKRLTSTAPGLRSVRAAAARRTRRARPSPDASNASCGCVQERTVEHERVAPAAVRAVTDDRMADRARGARGSDACDRFRAGSASRLHHGLVEGFVALRTRCAPAGRRRARPCACDATRSARSARRSCRAARSR